MGRAVSDGWPEDDNVVVPPAWRGTRPWIGMQSEAQARISKTLRDMNAELLQQPLSPRLTRLIRAIEVGLETPLHDR
ncbi:hypothetical protein JKG68_08955 [Microvirga aerilata]|uniref:Uncharacterized protein n=1 Tax=Microvirga aerilata TaxID=670292 RepID=A0A936Z6V2_9HYPH|nr:hypothetical protein [Microvirga aerilata]MBL0404091.1 hypothetical protein [Microvirga aerilata]